MADDVRTYETDKYIIKINRTQCIGCGTCSAIAPKTFELDKDCKTYVLPSSDDSLETILQATQSCAVEAIVVIDKKTNEEIYPNSA